MEARFASAAISSAVLLGICLVVACPSRTSAAGYRTANFTVSAPTPQLAKEIGDRAEACRRDLAIAWLGQELPQLGKAVPDSCPSGTEIGRRRGHELRVRPRRSVRLEDEHPRLARADPGFGLAA